MSGPYDVWSAGGEGFASQGSAGPCSRSAYRLHQGFEGAGFSAQNRH